jgi:hypothetical protein
MKNCSYTPAIEARQRRRRPEVCPNREAADRTIVTAQKEAARPRVFPAVDARCVVWRSRLQTSNGRSRTAQTVRVFFCHDEQNDPAHFKRHNRTASRRAARRSFSEHRFRVRPPITDRFVAVSFTARFDQPAA